MHLLLRRTALAAALSLALSTAQADTRAVVAASPSTPQALGAAVADSQQILLRGGIFNPLTQRLDLGASGVADVQSQRYALIQFDGESAQARKALAAQGVEFVNYVPNNAWQVRLNGVSLAAINAHAGVRWSEAMRAGSKVDPQLWPSYRASAFGEAGLAMVDVQVIAFRGESASSIANALSKSLPNLLITNVNEKYETGDRVRVSIAAAQVDALLQAASELESVAWIERYNAPTTKNSGDPGTLQGNATAACAGSGVVCGNTPIWNHNLYGTGQIVAIADTGLDRNEAYFTTLDKGAGPVTALTDAEMPALPSIGSLFLDRKVVAYWTQPGATSYDYNSGHGTHVAGTVAGDAAGTFGATTYVASTPTSAGHELADGNAPNAQLLIQDIGTGSSLTGLNDLVGTLKQAYAGQARIHSNSWGGGSSGDYDSSAGDVDYFTGIYEDMLFVVAAGNDGPSARTLGSPGTAKNALTVGGTAHGGTTSMYGSSSRGPTADGRIKPDIMAPAMSVVSAAADTNNSTTMEAPANATKTGTSMATPAIAGNAALVRQYFTEGYYPRGVKTAADALNPSGVIMKAVLLNGTNPLSVAANNWPDMNYGWGRAWLDSNLWFSEAVAGSDDTRRMRLFERTNKAGLATGDVNEYTIANVTAGQELRATLTWYDPEGAPGAAVSLVNNLDLEVVAPGGAIYRGNVFAGGLSTTGGNGDLLNTVEQVRLAAPTAGSYTFRVKATAVPGNGRAETDRQGYGLAVTGVFALPDPTPAAAPATPTVASNTTAGVAIGFGSVSGAQSYQLYRADGTCATAAAGDFRLVANGSASPLVDTRSQGGFGYAYKVRGIQNDVEGNVSACVDVVSQDECSLQPSINGAELAVNGANATCKVDLTWTAGTASCPAATGVTYSILRSSDPYMAGATTVATGLTSLTFSDTSVTTDRSYHYRVIATDNLGNASGVYQSPVKSVTTSSALGPNPVTFLDDPDNRTYVRLETPWQITNTAAATGSYSYHSSKDNQGYVDSTCAAIETPALQIPAGGGLSFQAQYNFEYGGASDPTFYDGAVQEISTDGGATWVDLPPTGGYPGVLGDTADACGYPTGKGAFVGVTTTTSNAGTNNNATAIFKPFGADLSAYAGQTVKLRWRVSTDSGVSFPGMFIDQIRVGTLDVTFRSDFDSNVYMCQ